MLPRSSWKKLVFIVETHLVGKPPPRGTSSQR
jgi:hypothetical protein